MTKYDLSMTKYDFLYFVKTEYNLSRQYMVCLTSYFVNDIYTVKWSNLALSSDTFVSQTLRSPLRTRRSNLDT